MSEQESFAKNMMNVTDEQLAHNMRVWEEDQQRLQRKLAKKEAKRKWCNNQLAEGLKGIVAKKKS
jgi:hypothetical protein